MTFKTNANVTIPPNAVPPEGEGFELYRRLERAITNDGQNEVNVADWIVNVSDPNSGITVNANITDGDPGFTNNFVSLESIANAEKTVLFSSNYNAGFDNAFDWATVFNDAYLPAQRNASDVDGNDSIGPVDFDQARLPLIIDAADISSDVFEIFSNNYLKFPNQATTYIEKQCLFQPNNSAVGASSFRLRSWKGGTATPFIQSEWNIDTFDGSGSNDNPSGLSLDFSLIQTLVIEVNNRSHARLRIGFLIEDRYYFAHEFVSNNTTNELPFGNLNLPIVDFASRFVGGVIRGVGIFDGISGITFETTTDTTSTPTALLEYFDYSTVAYAVGSGIKYFKSPYTADMEENYVDAVTNPGAFLMAIRPIGNGNKSIFDIDTVNISTRTPNLNDEAIVEVWWNPTITGGTWNALSSYSGLEMTTNPTSFLMDSNAIKIGSKHIKGSHSTEIKRQDILSDYQNAFSMKSTNFNGSPISNVQRGTIALIARSMPFNSVTEPVRVTAAITGGEVG